MKKSLYVIASGLFLLTACVSHDIDEVQPQPKVVTQDEINENVKKMFGVTFDPNHDWNTTVNGKVTITISNSELKDVEKVQILTLPPFGNEDANGSMSLNETTASYGQTVTLNYDAPEIYKRLYAACVMKDGTYFIKGFNVGEQNVVFTSNTVNASRTRAGETGFDLDSLVSLLPVSPKLASKEESYNNSKGRTGWSEDYLYTLPELAQGETDPYILNIGQFDYTEDYKKDLRAALFDTYLPNKKDNINKIKASYYWKGNKNYPLTTGDDPIILAPVYKNDSIYKEIENCDLYYYYFKMSDLAGKTGEEQVAYLKKLPKYRAIQLYHSVKKPFQMTNNVIKRETAYALIYWGEGEPVLGQTEGSYTFPKGYSIGFMVRSLDEKQKRGDEKDGELYCDGRLNTEINNYGHFKTSGLKDDDPRMTWFWDNKKQYLCCESGSDRDFNDVVFEVLGGIMAPPPPKVDKNKYTFCFEDTPLGDYDLNDVVIRAYRQDKTHVVWQVVACGAYDEVYIKNIKGTLIAEDREVHSMFPGKAPLQFINTEQPVPETTPFPTEIQEVPEDFSFLKEEYQPYIYDGTTGVEVKLALVGQDPHGIMVPYEFRYPLERQRVCWAYPDFNSWGQGAYIIDEDEEDDAWYKHPVENLVSEKIDTLNVTYQP